MAIEPTAGNLAATSIAARSPTSDFTPLVDDATTGITRALSAIMQPVYEEIDTGAIDRRVVGFVWFRLDWAIYLQNILAENTNGIIAVIRGSCPVINVFDYTFGQSSEGQNFDGYRTRTGQRQHSWGRLTHTIQNMMGWKKLVFSLTLILIQRMFQWVDVFQTDIASIPFW